MVLLEIAQDKMVASNKVKVSWGRIDGAKMAPFYVMIMDSRSGLEVSKKVRFTDEFEASVCFDLWIHSELSAVDSLLGIHS